jgi:hypothetical protein
MLCSAGLNFSRFTVFEHCESRWVDCVFFERDRQVFWRQVERFVREHPCPPVNGERVFCTQVGEDLHALVGVHVLRFHEPPRLVGTDRNRRPIEAARKSRCDVFEVLAVASVAGVDEAPN